MTRQQLASLLATAFLCTFPMRNEQVVVVMVVVVVVVVFVVVVVVVEVVIFEIVLVSSC